MIPHLAVIITTRIVTDRLSNEELAALYMAITCDFDPRPVLGYEKAKPLFTEVYNGIPRMHSDTRYAFGCMVQERLAPFESPGEA